MPSPRSWLLAFFLPFLILVQASAQVPLRILNPPQAAGSNMGWTVDAKTGLLFMNVPVATVGGEIPVPVVFRYNASWSSEYHWLKYWQANSPLKAQSMSLTAGGAQPALGGGGQWMWAWYPLGRSIFGTVHFGFITDNAAYSVTDPSDGTTYTITPTRSYVLEDGTQFTDTDFTSFATSVGGNFSLPPLFNFGARATSSVNVNSQGTLVSYDATSADLGTWASTATSLAPVGYTSASGYKVLMDRDRARVYAYAKELNSWVPILWVDRFGHYVGFQWKAFKTGLPSGISAVNTVKVLNHRNKGVQVQWAQPTAGASAPSQVLVRADFINIQAPTLQIAGYSSLSGSMNLKADTSGPVVRPTEVRFGNPSGSNLTAPAWMAAALPQPSSTGSWTWPSDRVWTFGYDASLGEVTSISDASLGVTTAFTSTLNAIWNTQASVSNDLRSVSTANTTDNIRGTHLNATWGWALPTNSSATTWVTTYTQSFSGPGFSSGASTTTRYTFNGPGAPAYGNGPLSKIEILDSGNNVISSQTYTQSLVGVDGSLSYVYPSLTTTQSAPTINMNQTIDWKTGTPTYVSVYSTGYSDNKTYAYDRHPELLDPARVTSMGQGRTSPSGNTSAPLRNIGYDATKMLPNTTYIDGGSLGTIGQNMGYDTAGHLNSISNFASYSTSGTAAKSYTLDPTSGLPTSLSVTYDGPSGTNAYSQTWSGYDSADRPTSVVDGLNVTTTTIFDAYGRPTSVAKGGQATVSYIYSSDLRTQTTRANGFSKVETRDGFGNLITRQRGQDGVLETYTPDSNGRVTQLVETKGGSTRTTIWTYDTLGRKASITPPSDAGAPVTYTYTVDGNGNQVVTSNFYPVNYPSAFSTVQNLDLWGQAVNSVDAQGNVTITSYDGLGRPISITRTPPSGSAQTRTFSYDSLGRLTSRSEPETGTTTYGSYNAQGLPTTITEAGSRTRQIGYDGLGRTRSATNGSDNQTFTFNGLAPASSTASSAGQATSIQYGLDPYGRVNAETISAPGSSSWAGIGYHYDAVGRLDQLTYPSTRVVTYQYDDSATGFGRLDQLTTGASTVRVDYDSWGNRKNIYYPSSAKSTYQTSVSGTRVDSWTVTPVSGAVVTRSYAYDGLNHLLAASSNDPSNPEWTILTHNALGQLTVATGFGVTGMSLNYDGYGNNTSSNVGAAPGGFINYSFNPLLDNRIPTQTNTSVTTGWNINARGEATTIGTNVGSVPAMSFAWDGLGRLSSTTLNSVTQTYAYLPTGLRVQLLDNGNGGNNRRYAYTSGGLLLGEYTGSGTSWAWKRDTIYLGSKAVLEIDGYGNHELHSDLLGTPRFISNSSGAQEGSQAFGPYGEALPGQYNSGYQSLTGYTGHAQTDPGTGLIYMRGRYYSPAWHRFINSDQGADSNSLNQFAYVSGKPFSSKDPSGMIDTQIDGISVSNSLFASLAGLLSGRGSGPGNGVGGALGGVGGLSRSNQGEWVYPSVGVQTIYGSTVSQEASYWVSDEAYTAALLQLGLPQTNSGSWGLGVGGEGAFVIGGPIGAWNGSRVVYSAGNGQTTTVSSVGSSNLNRAYANGDWGYYAGAGANVVLSYSSSQTPADFNGDTRMITLGLGAISVQWGTSPSGAFSMSAGAGLGMSFGIYSMNYSSTAYVYAPDGRGNLVPTPVH